MKIEGFFFSWNSKGVTIWSLHYIYKRINRTWHAAEDPKVIPIMVEQNCWFISDNPNPTVLAPFRFLKVTGEEPGSTVPTGLARPCCTENRPCPTLLLALLPALMSVWPREMFKLVSQWSQASPKIVFAFYDFHLEICNNKGLCRLNFLKKILMT